MSRAQLYWIVTALLLAWLALGGALDVARAAPVREIMRTLHYPDYLLLILGPCKVLAVAALLHPGTRLVREWAYAGITINCLGAFASHCAVRDDLGSTVAPLVMQTLAVASYLLRPAKLRVSIQ